MGGNIYFYRIEIKEGKVYYFHATEVSLIFSVKDFHKYSLLKPTIDNCHYYIVDNKNIQPFSGKFKSIYGS